jgi:hypothetical protein
MTGAGDERKVSSLRELPQALEPSRDLWPQIEARIREESMRARAAPSAPARVARLRWLAAAAVVASVAVGVWIGRSFLPGARAPGAEGALSATAQTAPGAASALDAAYVSDRRYQRQRTALLQSLQAQLAAMPPPARDKVVASFTAIGKAKEDLEQALGKDPSNALLQELLINTYQDEMRVLTDMREASDAGRGI